MVSWWAAEGCTGGSLQLELLERLRGEQRIVGVSLQVRKLHLNLVLSLCQSAAIARRSTAIDLGLRKRRVLCGGLLGGLLCGLLF